MKPRCLPDSGWLALGFSVGAHVLLFAAVLLLPRESPRAPRALAVDTCVLAPEDDPPPRPPTPPTRAVADPPRQPGRTITARLLPGPAVSPSSTPPPSTGAEPAAPHEASSGPGDSVNDDRDSHAAGGGPGISLFQVNAEGRSVVYVIDRSVSMGLNGGLAAAKREVLASLEQLPAVCHFQLLFYNRDAELLRLEGGASLLPVNPNTRASAARFLETLRASGSTDHLDALKRALALQPDVIFLVTDADDLTAEQVRVVTNWNQGRSAIHAIELSAREAAPVESPLALLARSNRGSYRLVPLAAGE